MIYDALGAAGRLRRIEVQPRSDLSGLLTDPVYLGMISWRVNNLENLLEEVDIVEASIHDILKMLESNRD